MSHATDQARSTRDDARAFADAFAAADDAFTFGPDPGESRTLTLDELGEVIALNRSGAGDALPAAPLARPRTDVADDQLLTLDELGEALARPAREADVLDFDFGTSAHERARRRTAARLDASPSDRRRASGPAAAAARSRAADLRLAEVEAASPGRRAAAAATRDGRLAMADAAASAAERLAQPPGATRPVAGRPGEAPHASRRIPLALRLTDEVPADPAARHKLDVAGRPATPAPSHARRDRRPLSAADLLGSNPDRIAMWAVLLGILLVLIAFTSGSAAAVALPLLGTL